MILSQRLAALVLLVSCAVCGMGRAQDAAAVSAGAFRLAARFLQPPSESQPCCPCPQIAQHGPVAAAAVDRQVSLTELGELLLVGAGRRDEGGHRRGVGQAQDRARGADLVGTSKDDCPFS